LLADDPLFSETAIFGNLLHLVTSNPDAGAIRAREILESAGIPVIRIEAITPSLEDVFVTLTAKDRKDEM